MIKTIAILCIFAAIGATIFYFFGSTITNYITSITPRISNIFANTPTQITNLYNYAKQNWLQITGIISGVSVGAGLIYQKLYGLAKQKQALESNEKILDVQRQYIQLSNQKETLETKATELQGQVTVLKENAEDAMQLKTELADLKSQLDKVITERNQLASLLPNVKTAEQLINEKLKVH